MTMIRKLVRAVVTELEDDVVEVVMSTDALARDGHVLVPQGCRLDNYLANPIVLWAHDADTPIGNAEDIEIGANQIRCRIRFAPLGISPKADEIRGLMKARVIRAVSISFDPLDGEPLDPRKPRGGQRFVDWELLELSAVSVPSDTGAVVTARAYDETGEQTMAETDPSGAEGAPPPAGTTAPIARTHRTNHRGNVVAFARGLYDVAELCYMFERLGWQVDHAKYEAAIEGDQSQVPAMLGEVLQGMGDALLEMAAEEIAEALAGRVDAGVDTGDAEIEDDEVLSVEERAHIRAGGSDLIRTYRRGLAHAKLRAGKSLSTETVRCLREARDLHQDAMALHRSAMRKHKDGVGAIDDLLERAGVAAETSEAEADGGGANDRAAQIQRRQHAPAPPPAATIPPEAGYRRRQAELLALTAQV